MWNSLCRAQAHCLHSLGRSTFKQSANRLGFFKNLFLHLEHVCSNWWIYNCMIHSWWSCSICTIISSNLRKKYHIAMLTIYFLCVYLLLLLLCEFSGGRAWTIKIQFSSSSLELLPLRREAAAFSWHGHSRSLHCWQAPLSSWSFYWRLITALRAFMFP